MSFFCLSGSAALVFSSGCERELLGRKQTRSVVAMVSRDLWFLRKTISVKALLGGFSVSRTDD